MIEVGQFRCWKNNDLSWDQRVIYFHIIKIYNYNTSDDERYKHFEKVCDIRLLDGRITTRWNIYNVENDSFIIEGDDD